MTIWVQLGILAAVAFSGAAPAQAYECRGWIRLDNGKKENYLYLGESAKKGLNNFVGVPDLRRGQEESSTVLFDHGGLVVTLNQRRHYPGEPAEAASRWISFYKRQNGQDEIPFASSDVDRRRGAVQPGSISETRYLSAFDRWNSRVVLSFQPFIICGKQVSPREFR